MKMDKNQQFLTFFVTGLLLLMVGFMSAQTASASFGDDDFEDPEIISSIDDDSVDGFVPPAFDPRRPRSGNNDSRDNNRKFPRFGKNKSKTDLSPGSDRFGKPKNKIIFRLVEDENLIRKMKEQRMTQAPSSGAE